ncbi:hypothetical protein M5D96_014199, partial [Drosophila gunungcola]
MTKLREKIDLDQQMLTARNDLLPACRREPSQTGQNVLSSWRERHADQSGKQRAGLEGGGVAQPLRDPEIQTEGGEAAAANPALKEQEERIVTMQEE